MSGFNTEELRKAAEKAKGVYRSGSNAIHVSENVSPTEEIMSNVIIATAANYGYINHLHNFECYLNRLNMKALFLAMDNDMHEYVSHLAPLPFIHTSNSLNKTTEETGWHERQGEQENRIFTSFLLKSNEGIILKTHTGFHTPQFHLITVLKKAGVLALLQLGYHVLFIDLDVALLRDPLPYLIWSNVDYVHSMNKICSNK